MLLTADHIDLLTTALHDWHLLAPEDRDDTAMVASVGSSLRQANLASEHALARVGRLEPHEAAALEATPTDYTWSPVESPYEPVDVLKATHAALQACSLAPQWDTTRLRRILDALTLAAAQRLPGYDTAPWNWERPERITETIGFAGVGTPFGVPGLVWVDAATLDECWESAVVVVVLASALEMLDVTLPARRNLVVLLEGEPLSDEQWALAAGLGPATVVDAQMGMPWLTDLLARMNRYVPSPNA